MSYDIEMVKKFANLNRELIEKTAKDHPEIGGLIKQIIESIVEGEVAPEEKPYVPVSTDGARWEDIPAAQKRKSLFFKTDSLPIRSDALAFLLSASPLAKGLFVIGDFYQLQDDTVNRNNYNRLYKPLKEDETSLKYVLKYNYAKYFDIEEIYITVPKNFEFNAELMLKFLVDLDIEKLDEAKKGKLETKLRNELIFDFLIDNEAEGFFSESEDSWFKPVSIERDSIVLEDFYGRKIPFDFDKLYKELTTSLYPAQKPKFNINDKVIAVEKSKARLLGEGKISKRYYNAETKIYVYDVEYPTAVVHLKESEIENFTPQTPQILTPKKTVNPTPSPAEIEYSNMTQEQLKIEKEGIEEALTYLDDEDEEKNDLEIQLELVNLYLEN